MPIGFPWFNNRTIITLNDFLLNPAGRKTSYGAKRENIIKDLHHRYDEILKKTNGKLQYDVYNDGNGKILLKNGTVSASSYYISSSKIYGIYNSGTGDITIENGTINIEHSVYDKPKDEKGRWYIGSTKTETGTREIYIGQTLKKALQSFKDKQLHLRELYGKKYIYSNKI